jgi:hypothetical protein
MIFSLRHRCVQTGSWPHSAPYPMGVTDFFPGVKRAGSKADHSPPRSVEFKNAWWYTRVYPKVSGLVAWSENCKWHSSLTLGAVVSLFRESV